MFHDEHEAHYEAAARSAVSQMLWREAVEPLAAALALDPSSQSLQELWAAWSRGTPEPLSLLDISGTPFFGVVALRAKLLGAAAHRLRQRPRICQPRSRSVGLPTRSAESRWKRRSSRASTAAFRDEFS